MLTQPAQETRPVRTTGKDWPTFLRAIAEKAQRDPHHRFGDLYRWLNQDVLRWCFYQLRKDAASGVDGVTYQAYEQNLEGNLADLVGRLKRKAYRARLVRRKYIPKGEGKYRPLGIPALEDKLLQMAATQILLAIYEGDFLKCSYGYRPGLGPHDAVRALTDELFRGEYNFVVEADIRGFFDHIQWDWLMKMLGRRIQDGALLGLIRKWLRAGILEEDGRVIHPETGTPQGGVISPVLANVYLHHVLDLWFERVVEKRNRGGCKLYRFADDFVACFEYGHEAAAFEKDLKERLGKFGLEVAPEKTQTLRFGRNGGPHNGRFDFLGFEFYWEASRKGKPIVKRRTARKKWRGGVQRMKEWIKTNRNQKIRELMRTLAAKLRGTWNYYGIIGNSQKLSQFHTATLRLVFKWLNRRRSYTWRTFNRLLRRFQIPPPRIVEKPTARMPCQLELNLYARVAQFVRQVAFQGAHARVS
jgi:group II intron reverse transcriptase/maturase